MLRKVHRLPLKHQEAHSPGRGRLGRDALWGLVLQCGRSPKSLGFNTGLAHPTPFLLTRVGRASVVVADAETSILGIRGAPGMTPMQDKMVS